MSTHTSTTTSASKGTTSGPVQPTGNTTTSRPSTPTSGGTVTGKPTEPHGGNTTASSTITTIQQPTEITTNMSTTAIPTPGPLIVCPLRPCPLLSICFNGACQCLTGTFLVNDICVPAQVFPGQLHFGSMNFEPEMRDRSSTTFQKKAALISAGLRDALKDLQGYIRSDVVELQPGSVRASVNNYFKNTNVTQETVDRTIVEAIANSKNGTFANTTFVGTKLCDQPPLACDASTTLCTTTKGSATCSCKEGYISNMYSNTTCRACPSGQRAVGDTCQTCAFGYSGFNCNDSALLAVVVISCVLGGILLIIILVLLICCCRRGCSKTKDDYSTGLYASGDSNQPWPTGITPIPRATTNWHAGSSIEMTEGSGNQGAGTNGLTGSYDLNPEAMKTFKGKNPSRYSYLVQGHENPYFLPGDEKQN
uniref:SEA domain-containing protein n=1 Tax=Monopterus albus TaxID=43700 RepID=A0A3Q3QGP2_MONAL